MKKIKTKRLIFCRGSEYLIGATEYDGKLTDENILQSFHEVGKTIVYPYGMWLLKNGEPYYRVSVCSFYQYQKSWYNLVSDNIKRILRI